MDTTEVIERLCLLLGVSSLLSAFALFIALRLAVPFTEPAVMVALNLTIALGVLGQLWRPAPPAMHPLIWPSKTTLLILCVIFAIALLTRATRLGYAEFHEDELENMRLIVRAYKGEAYAAFLDSKGPIHWLLPAALWYLNGWVNETIARLPVLLTALLLIPMMYALGRRMSGGNDSVGLIAATFVTLNGFFVAYARHVENQSLIVFWGALTMWWAYRYYQNPTAHHPFLFYIAFALAIGLIAHPDVLLYLPVFGYMLLMSALKQKPQRIADSSYPKWSPQFFAAIPRIIVDSKGLSWLLGAGLLFTIITASFYLPYLTDPQIGLVYQYFASDRIGESLFYNRVHNLFDQDQLYSTRYHAPVLVLLLTWLLARMWARRGRWGLIIFSGFALAIISTVALPEWWFIRQINFAFFPYALLTLTMLWLPEASFEIKTLYLWLTAPLGALLFLAQDAADHVQIAYTAWALLAALATVDLWTACNLPTKNHSLAMWERAGVRVSPSLIRLIGHGSMILIALVVTPITIFYQYLTFDSTVITYWQAKQESVTNPNSIYNWLYGDIARPRKLFSNPRLGGWKAAGYLYEKGLLQHDFRSVNESYAVPIWYTFETPRSCYDDPENYWVQRDWKGWPDEEQKIITQGYTLTRVVLVDNEPKLHLYQKHTTITQPETINMEDYRHAFDLLATPNRFAQGEVIQKQTDLNFGDKLQLYGYNLPTPLLSNRDTARVTVFWQALVPMPTRYRAFLHLIDSTGHKWAQQDDDPACRLLTTEMRVGQTSTREFRLTLNPAMPYGEYQLVLGLYDPTSQTRLPIWDNKTQQSPGDSLVLGTVQIH